MLRERQIRKWTDDQKMVIVNEARIGGKHKIAKRYFITPWMITKWEKQFSKNLLPKEIDPELIDLINKIRSLHYQFSDIIERVDQIVEQPYLKG